MATHDHGADPSSGEQSVRRLALVVVINFIGFAVELVGGLAFGSVALLSDAFHMLFDALAYVIALGAPSSLDARIRAVGGPTASTESNRSPRS
jgi:cobalt-zinc-cadmium efflux system protein